MKLKEIDKKFAFNKELCLEDIKMDKMDWYASDGRSVLIYINGDLMLLSKDADKYEIYLIQREQLFDCGKYSKEGLKVIGEGLREYADKRIHVSVANCYL